MGQRPRRQKLGDRLLSSDARKAEVACDHAVAPLDRLARQMDQKWGIDRLPELVRPETAARYGSALAKLNAAIAAEDPDETARRAQVCMRGLAAMNREAEEAGHEPPDILAEYDLDGFHFAIMAENEDWAPIKAARPDLRLFSLREIAIALKHIADNPLIREVKDQFPMAEIASVKARAEAKEHEDELPW